MNRIILIGNGFDLAHGLSTNYKHFIEWYWNEWLEKLRETNQNKIDDKLCSFENKSQYTMWNYLQYIIDDINNKSGYKIARDLLKTNKRVNLIIKPCKFLENINEAIETKNWVDIENEYYKLLNLINDTNGALNTTVHDLNEQLHFLQDKLICYLNIILKADTTFIPKINEIIYSPIKMEDIAVSEKESFNSHLDFWKNCDEGEFLEKLNYYNVNKNIFDKNNLLTFKHFIIEHKTNNDEIFRRYPCFFLPDKIMIINFNYTNTANQYLESHNPLFEINHIHGELSRPNSIIFGYGDELDENYSKISNLNDNEYLKNFKSIKYLESDRYRKALQFMDAAPYQVFIMGHSCGNSDRTFLNTLFEHKNCVSIKPYYHKRKDGKDNYLDIVQNISRNFTDMKLMRDRVVNKTFCEPFSEEQ